MSEVTDTKTKPKKAAAAAMVSLSVLGGASAIAATANLEIFAEIAQALDLTVTASMQFGTLAATGANGGELTLRPESGEVILDTKGGLSFAGGIPQVGRIRVRGAPRAIDVSVAAKTIELTNGTTSVVVKDFNFMTNSGGSHITITPTSFGATVAFPVGATLVARPGQVAGTYVGNNTIFANYQ